MFSELEKYLEKGHFFFSKEDSLREKSRDVPNKPGVYYFLKLSKGKIELVYIGKSGSLKQDGGFKKQFLRERLNNKQGGIKRQDYFKQKMENEQIDAIDVYWFVTMDNQQHNDLPGYVEGLILQRYFEIYGCLPAWNESF